MDSIVELSVLATGGTATGIVDLYGTEPITLSMSISDVKDIKKRKTTFSHRFTVPGSKNNNILFNNIFEIGIDCQFDPRKKTPCQLTIDTLPVMSNGQLQLTGIIVDDQNNVVYEIVVQDEAISLIDTIGDAELTDLDFSDMTHNWDYNGITNSWTGNGTYQTYFYPLIDYYDFTITNMNSGNGVEINQIFPATQVKTIVDRIFSAAGFSYTSTLFDSSYFKNLYLPYNGTVLLNQVSGFSQDRSFQAQTTATTITNVPAPVTLPVAYTYNSPFAILEAYEDTSYPNFDNGNLYSATSFTYSSDTYSEQIFSVQLDYEFSCLDSLVSFSAMHTVKFFRSTHFLGLQPYDTVTEPFGTSPINTRKQKIFSANLLNAPTNALHEPAKPGELFWVEISFHFEVATSIPTTITHTLYPDNTFFYNFVSNKVLPNQTIDYNSWIPKKTKQIDFINSLLNMHNAYVVPDKNNSKKLLIEARDTYYATGTTKNWTNKLDLTQKVNEQLLSEQTNKRFVFSYKEDKDFYNENFKVATNRVFGDEYVVIDNNFIKEDKKITDGIIFSPTPSVAVLESGAFVPPGSPTITADEFIIPKIGKVDSSGNFGKTEFNLRILQKHANTLLPLLPVNNWKLAGNNQTKYPYLGHLSHPITGNTDVNFGAVRYEYYKLDSITNQNLVNRYWRTYLDQIADKDSKLITCYIHLNPFDIQDFKFSDSIFADGLTDEGGHYYIVNSIDYVATANVSSKVELIKVKEKHVNSVRTGIVGHITLPTQVISLAGGVTYSTGSVAVGTDVIISQGSPGSVGIGSKIIVEGGSPSSVAYGEDLKISAGSGKSFIIGSGITVNEFSTNTFAVGNNITIASGLTGVMAIGDNINAISGNTLYTNNIVLSSGSTINGTPLSAVTGGPYLPLSGGSMDSLAVIKSANGGGQIDLDAFGTAGEVLITNDNGAYGDSYIDLYTGGIDIGTTGAFTITGNNGYLYSNGSFTKLNSDFGRLLFQSGNTELNGLTNLKLIAATDFKIYSSGVGANIFQFNGDYSGYFADDSLVAKPTILIGTTDSTVNSGVTNSVILGGIGLTATTSNTVYVPNITIAYGGTINGTAFSAITGSSFLWSAGTGPQSIILNTIGGNTASGQYSFAGGSYNLASGYNSLIVGGKINTATTSYSTIVGGFGNESSGYNSIVGAGKINRASGNFSSIAGGAYNIASAQYSSIGGGKSNTASGVHSSVIGGKNNLASGAYSSVLGGLGNTSSGAFSTSEGSGTTASGIASHAEGRLSEANNYYAHAEGHLCFANGSSSHAECHLTYSNGNYSHSEGDSTRAYGTASHAEGDSSVASGDSSHAEGFTTVAFGNFSHSEGYVTTASGTSSHSGGENTFANGNSSFVHGTGSTANGVATIVLGCDITGNKNNTVYAPALELENTLGYLLLNRLTTTQRNALTAVNGMLIYNTTDNKFQGYENSVWVNLI